MDERCTYCRRQIGENQSCLDPRNHNSDCPYASPGEYGDRLIRWHRGHDDACAGRIESSADPVYMLGYDTGRVELQQAAAAKA